MEILVGSLAFGTLSAFVVFGYLSAKRTTERLHSDTPPSTLAVDGPNSRKNNKEIMPDL